ncbi:dTDP-4-dehydrorhamnose reductase [Devosia limi]|nr:dTDP-4-dehydrorhamnose reductase [Devosia limi]
MRLAVTGTSGQLASSLIEVGANAGVEIIPIGRPQLDLAGSSEGIAAALAAAAPDIIVSAAAYTAVDRAETERDLAFAINATGAGAVAAAAAMLGVPVIHISTDYVFDGRKPTPYLETDPTGPLGVYGASKLAGEQAVAAATPNHAILRTAWVYSPFGNNFLRTMLRLAGERDELRVVADQYGNPTSALDLAAAILVVARNLVATPDDPGLRGIFHATGTGDASWAEFAAAIFHASAALGGPTAKVKPIPATAYPTPAARPANSRLDTTRLNTAHGARMPAWRQSSEQVVSRLLKAR